MKRGPISLFQECHPRHECWPAAEIRKPVRRRNHHQRKVSFGSRLLRALASLCICAGGSQRCASLSRWVTNLHFPALCGSCAARELEMQAKWKLPSPPLFEIKVWAWCFCAACRRFIANNLSFLVVTKRTADRPTMCIIGAAFAFAEAFSPLIFLLVSSKARRSDFSLHDDLNAGV